MTRFKLLALAAAATLTTFAAQAQQIGLYVGTTSQGQTFEVQVTDDGFGNPLFHSATVFWSATCAKSGPGRFTAWGVGLDIPIVSRKVVTDVRYNQLYEKFDLKWNAAGNRVTGKFQGKTSEFESIATSTRSVELCDSSLLDVTADFQVPSAERSTGAAAGAVKAWPIAR